MKRHRWVPYLLLLPSVVYLALLFIYPMTQAVQLAFTREGQFLNLRAEPTDSAAVTGALALQTEVRIVERSEQQETLQSGAQRPIFWYRVEAEDESGATVEGWVSIRNVFIENRRTSETARITSGEAVREFSLMHFNRMFTDFRFDDALWTTFLLIILIIPAQFVLAIIMALVLQSQIRFSSMFLYVYAIPLGLSDLVAGILWFAIFTQRGFLNSLLVGGGWFELPFIFIQAQQMGWMITIIVLAEIWRATSIVMVIVVSGLQAIPRDYLEAGEVFGASLWQRLWHIILPLLKPSLQVALILRTILALQVFAIVIAITGGDILTVLANETFRWYDPARFNSPNMAAAYSVFIMVISLGVSLFYLRAVRSQEEAVKTL
ncbi:MAG: ABC transporter permease subunit [Anaerolinea sp.]|nr:ABC transporter permease subunit [Anaerolinea sp.]